MQRTSDNFHSLQNEYFQAAAQHCITQCRAHYRNRLQAIYVWGSVHRQEAIRGVSDLDLLIFPTDAPTEQDEQWRIEVNGEFGKDLPASPYGLIPPAGSADWFLGGLGSEDTSVRLSARDRYYLLRHDATLVYGQDLTSGLQVVPPDKEWAEFCFQDSWKLIRGAAGLEVVGDSPFDLPEEPSLRQRKLARTAVISGAYLLAAHGAFRSFRGVDVLPVVKHLWPQWAPVVEATSQLYLSPKSVMTEQATAYLDQLVSWTDSIQEQLKN